MLQAIITSYAKNIGFDTVGFAPAALPSQHAEGLQSFLELGNHGSMGWMEDRAHLRANPQSLWPDAKTAILLGHNYGPAENPLQRLSQRDIGNISVYAQNQDYHDVIKKKLKTIARWLAQTQSCDVKVFVDTAPVMEKPLAEQAGLGWAGKHTCIVSREFGSWLFLGVILTTLDLSPALAQKKNQSIDHCGSCTKCLDICPTGAFTNARELDARRCISYLTIEHHGIIPHEFRKAIGNRIYGCDDCLAVCPWNKFAQNAQDSAYHPRAELQAPLLRQLVTLDDAGFRALFRKSPVKRIGRDRFIRNVLIAIGNSGDASLLSVIHPLSQDGNEVVREAASWALEELKKCTYIYSHSNL